MRPWTAVAAAVGSFILSAPTVAAVPTVQTVLSPEFQPPAVFKNLNLVRTTNLDKGYVRETVNVVVQNVDKQPQSEYYLPFPAAVFNHVGALEVRDKKFPDAGRFDVEAVKVGSSSSDVHYYAVNFPQPLAPKAEITLGISYSILSALTPRPAAIQQSDKQFLNYDFSAYAPSAYQTVTQKTKLKLPTTNVPDYTTTEGLKSGADPERQGTTYTYGPYDTAKVAPGTAYPVSVRYEFTKPVITASLLERDLEVSHWGGNLATEERYWLRNNGSHLVNQFSRVEWTVSSFQQQPSSAIRELTFPLKPGSVDPYFTDDIGNVSTSRYRPGKARRDASLELRPRFPIFGGWNYSFRIGWNNNLASFLRQGPAADTYVLKVPFLEGPKVPEGVQYDQVVVRVILPEGAHNVRYETLDQSTSNGLPGPHQISAEVSPLKTYMDTLGRTVLTLTAEDLTDEARDSQLVITYEYTLWDSLRKPATITAGLLATFIAAWAVGQIDVSIKKR
ncbi:putative oligosaccharyl transferase subunit [Aspergillus campestris IBT 28561]|uniref:Dolichyl-diphosphooligosaccharide--protein glycosyltransferase subunit 1 n=1 Tax=Aspergillus campestris (strain IBT 28561) TaxID=1392248 RepID=A0A2I1CZA9_ASPC2|nr:putative oligosaccharyl transferase subunit [Aspergillus campestris IBT 28561]PKY02946.1 putative oligosaccharyl transferase subunit [Aspergillus campestris IBT 28561]